MMTWLQLGAAERVAQKAAHMKEVDASGWTLTLVSVCVVFGVLLLLFVAYAIIGEIFMRRRSIRQAARKAVRLEKYVAPQNNEDKSGNETEVEAAIAMALHLYMESDSVHDMESGVITIRRQ